jgi:hypothetical protein
MFFIKLNDHGSDCIRKTYEKHGIERFYRGAGINIIRMAPNTAIQVSHLLYLSLFVWITQIKLRHYPSSQFGSYELLKQLSAGYF